MAEGQTEDLVTCAVCYEVFTDPRTLACGHTFCRSCLSSYTEECSEAFSSHSVLCPYCRQKTKVPNSQAPNGEWAGQITSSTLTRELADMAAIVESEKDTENDKSKSISKTTCDPHGDELVDSHAMLPGMIEEELASTRDMLKVASIAIEDRTEAMRSRLQDVENVEEVVCGELHEFCEGLVRAVRRKEVELVKDVRQKVEKQVKDIQLGIRLNEKSVRIQQQQSELIHNVLISGSEMDKLKMHQVCSKLFFDDEGSESDGLLDQITVTLKQDSVDRLLNGVFGDVKVEYRQHEFKAPVLDVDGIINIQIEDDEEIPFLVDIVVISHLGVYAIVVVDNSNCCARSIFMENDEVTQNKYEFSSSPWGIDKLVTNQVIVALPDSKQFSRLKVSPKLILLQNIVTRKSYRSVAVLDSTKLVAGVCKPEEACVDILDMEGNVLKSFTDEYPLKNPSYLSVMDQGHILISDFGLGTVTCVTTNGIMKFTKKRYFQGPSGVAVDRSGTIFVVDREEARLVEYETDAIHPKLTPLMTKIMKTPWGVSVDKSDNVYVTQGEIIRIYRGYETVIMNMPPISDIYN